MKRFIFSFLFILSSNLFSAEEPRVLCNSNQPQSQHQIVVSEQTVLRILGYEVMSGHKWVSVNGIKSNLLKPSEMGSTGIVEFLIDTKLQTENFKTYTFIFKRSWENEAVSTCRVTVVKN